VYLDADNAIWDLLLPKHDIAFVFHSKRTEQQIKRLCQMQCLASIDFHRTQELSGKGFRPVVLLEVNRSSSDILAAFMSYEKVLNSALIIFRLCPVSVLVYMDVYDIVLAIENCIDSDTSAFEPVRLQDVPVLGLILVRA
jgi:hypothetical protein